MEHADLSLEKCTDDETWDGFVRASPQGTTFSLSAFLAALDVGCERWVVLRRGQPVLATPLLVNDGIPIAAPYPMCVYHGIMLDSRSTTLPAHTRVSRTLDLVDFLLAQLSKVHDTMSFCLHHNFPDVRSLSWFGYHEPQLGRFHLDVRYSAVLDLAALDDLDGYLRTIRDARRAEYVRASDAGFSVEPRQDLDSLERLHRLTFERQGIELGAIERQVLRSAGAAMLAAGTGEFLACVAPTGEIASGTFFLRDDRSAYYWIGATDPEYRRTGAGTFALLESLRRSRAAGLASADFVGVNSPDRGDYKTSFNAAPVLYMVADWRRGVA